MIFKYIFTDGQWPNLSEGPASTWDFRRSIKEEEEYFYNYFGRTGGQGPILKA
jgi:hypothetical protein